MAKSKGEPRGRRCELPLLLRRIEEWDESDRDARSSSEVSSFCIVQWSGVKWSEVKWTETDVKEHVFESS